MGNNNKNEININQSIDIVAKDLAMQFEMDNMLGNTSEICPNEILPINNNAKIKEMETLKKQLELQQEKISQEKNEANLLAKTKK